MNDIPIDGERLVTSILLAACLALCLWHYVRAELEIRRLKAGNFSPREFQNLCHNFPPDCTEADFKAGCVDYWRKLFGPQPTVEDLAKSLRDAYVEDYKRRYKKLYDLPPDFPNVVDGLFATSWENLNERARYSYRIYAATALKVLGFSAPEIPET